MPDIVCLISQTTGKMIRALKGEEDIQTGELYVIESELGGDLAKSVEVSSGVCCVRKAGLGAVKIVRKASDAVKVTGKAGEEPTVKFESPLTTEATEVSVVTEGKGDAVKTDDPKVQKMALHTFWQRQGPRVHIGQNKRAFGGAGACVRSKGQNVARILGVWSFPRLLAGPRQARIHLTNV